MSFDAELELVRDVGALTPDPSPASGRGYSDVAPKYVWMPCLFSQQTRIPAKRVRNMLSRFEVMKLKTEQELPANFNTISWGCLGQRVPQFRSDQTRYPATHLEDAIGHR